MHGLSAAPTSQQWPVVLATGLEGKVVTLAALGAGYVTKGGSGSTFITEAKRVPRDASIVIFIGGAADSKVSALRAVKAATLALADAAQQASKSRLIAIRPLPSAEATAIGTKVLRQTLRVPAATAGTKRPRKSRRSSAACAR